MDFIYLKIFFTDEILNTFQQLDLLIYVFVFFANIICCFIRVNEDKKSDLYNGISFRSKGIVNGWMRLYVL